MSKKVEEKEVKEKSELISYSVGIFINNTIPKLKIYNYSDILKFEELNKTLKGMLSSLQEETRELLERHGIKEDLKPEDKDYDLVNKEYSKLILGSSNVSIDDLRVFSVDEFSRAFDGVGFNTEESILLSKCLIKK